MTANPPTEHADRASHWDTVYDTKGEDGVSWYQSTPVVTQDLLATAAVDHDAAIIDLGGGASIVVDHLLADGYADISVLDLSKVALERAKARLGSAADKVHWLHRDVLEWQPERRYHVWHDRAVFHFLVEEVERDAYVQALRGGLTADGRVIVATFDVDGPTHCSGLPVARYRAEDLAAVFAPHLELVTARRQEHITPAGVIQPFTWVLLAATE